MLENGARVTDPKPAIDLLPFWSSIARYEYDSAKVNIFERIGTICKFAQRPYLRESERESEPHAKLPKDHI